MAVPVTLAWLGSFASHTLQIFLTFPPIRIWQSAPCAECSASVSKRTFPYPHHFPLHRGILETVAYFTGRLVQGIRLYTAGRFSVDSKSRLIHNMLIVWILTGMWHGAAWNFSVLGDCSILHSWYWSACSSSEKERGKTAWRHLYVLLAVNLGWVLFRM